MNQLSKCTLIIIPGPRFLPQQNWILKVEVFKFRIHYRSGTKNKEVDYLLRHQPIAEIEQLEPENHSITYSDNIRLVSSSINTTHPLSNTVDINVLQLPNCDCITTITKTQLIDFQQQDTNVNPVYQFVQFTLHNKVFH